VVDRVTPSATHTNHLNDGTGVVIYLKIQYIVIHSIDPLPV
jgi:hypothetical protein